MNQRKILSHWFREVARHMTHLSKPQLSMLAASSLGLALAQKCTLNKVADKLPRLGKQDTMERRLQRFLSNINISWSQCSQALASWVIASLVHSQLVVLLVDETSLKDKLKVMVVSLAYRGRAIPLAWWCYHQEKWPMRQVELITTLLGWVQPGIPKGVSVLVEADRGIGTSPALLRAIEGMGWHYLVRVQGHVQLTLQDGQKIQFRRLISRVGESWHGEVQAMKKAGLHCWAIATWKKGQAEPWLLLTNYPLAQGNWYSIRMWEEEAFKDFKSAGWQWQQSRVWNPEHANRLWLVMALAYVWAISMGTHVVRSPELRKQLTRGKQKRCSVFQLGLRLFQYLFMLGRNFFYQLVLIPHVPLFTKTVV